MASKFFYFGFGSNMLASRIHIQNPTAKRIGAGKLEVWKNLFILELGFRYLIWIGTGRIYHASYIIL